MIGLGQIQIKAMVLARMSDIGVILDKDQPTTGMRFIGMGNRRTATVTLPENVSDDEFHRAVDTLVGEIEAGLKLKENSHG